MTRSQLKRFVRTCRETGKFYSRWGWSQRLSWAAETVAGHHVYKGAAIPNDPGEWKLRGWRIAERAARSVRS